MKGQSFMIFLMGCIVGISSHPFFSEEDNLQSIRKRHSATHFSPRALDSAPINLDPSINLRNLLEDFTDRIHKTDHPSTPNKSTVTVIITGDAEDLLKLNRKWPELRNKGLPSPSSKTHEVKIKSEARQLSNKASLTSKEQDQLFSNRVVPHFHSLNHHRLSKSDPKGQTATANELLPIYYDETTSPLPLIRHFAHPNKPQPADQLEELTDNSISGPRIPHSRSPGRGSRIPIHKNDKSETVIATTQSPILKSLMRLLYHTIPPPFDDHLKHQQAIVPDSEILNDFVASTKSYS